MEVHAELNSFVEDELRVVRLVNVGEGTGLDELVLVVDGGINHSISNSFSHYMLSLFTSLEHKLNSDIVDGDLRVGDVDLLQAEFNDRVS